MAIVASSSHSVSYLGQDIGSPYLDRDGFIVLKAFLDENEVAEIKTAVEALFSAPQDPTCSRPHNTLLPLRWKDRIVQLILSSERKAQVLSEALNADDPKWISGYVSIKEAHSPPLWWHQDWWCWDHVVSYRRNAAQVATLCYLSETNSQNGALRVLPGSHLRSAPIHAVLPEAHDKTAVDLSPGNIAMSDLSDQVTLCLRPGDAVAVDYRLLHGTHGNASDARRDCVILNFTPSWRQLPDDIKAHLIDHPAQPSESEVPHSSMFLKLLPAFNGPRQSLPLNRNAPAKFEVGD
jgi:Phytanoyl-CoA dioxygenase (PhyH)